MRVLGGVRGALGVAQLVSPGRVGWLYGVRLDHRARVVARVLGARQVVQAVLTAAMPTRAVRHLGVGVDALHAASMLALAMADSRRRRMALLDALLASTLAVAGVVTEPG